MALAEGRQLDGDDVEPIEEVLPHHALAHRRLEVAVGGGDQPDVRLDVLRVADPPDLAHLDRADELDLEQGRNLGDLVEEERAPLGRREEPDLVGHGAGERALDVSEQLGLHEALRESRRS